MLDINYVAEINLSNFRLFKKGVGIFLNEKMSACSKKEFKKFITEQLANEKILVVSSAGATNERTAHEKAILYNMGIGELMYIQPTLTLASYFGYTFTEDMPIMSVVIGEESTDLAIILGNEILYNGIVDVGINSCIHSINQFIYENFNGLELSFEQGKDIFDEIASLLPNDARYSKFPEFIIKAEQVRSIIYAHYEKIISSINHLLSEATAPIIKQITESGILLGGVGASLRGLSEAIYSILGLQSLIAQDCHNSTLIGAGEILNSSKLLLKLTKNT